MSRSNKPLPPHGDYKRYGRGCRCDLCCAAYSQARHAWYKGESAVADLNFVDAQPVREHVLQLEAGGMTRRQIGLAADVSSNQMSQLMNGRPRSGLPPTRRLNKTAAANLLRVTLNSQVSEMRLSSIVAQRKVQALAWLDFSQAEVATGTGLDAATIGYIETDECIIAADTHERIGRFYESVVSRRSTQGWTHRRAVAREFAPPWVWGGRIDDPAAEPDWSIPAPPGAVVSSARRNYVSAGDNDWVDAEFVRRYVQAEFLDHGMSLPAVALQAGMSLDTLRTVMRGRKSSPPPREIRAKTARRILRARFDIVVLGHGNTVDAMASRRRVRAMNWMGWTHPAIAREANLTKAFVAGISTGFRSTISYQSHLAILRAYGRLSGEIGPAIFTRQRAVRAGYAPPMAWNDQEIVRATGRPDWGMEIRVPEDLMLAQVRFLFMLGASFSEVIKITEQVAEIVRLQAASLGVGLF